MYSDQIALRAVPMY